MKIEKIKSILKSGGVGIMPTDTIYGLVGSALIPKTVTRIQRLKRRKQPPAKNISEAKKYFGRNLDFYLSGKIRQKPSKLIKFSGRGMILLRA